MRGNLGFLSYQAERATRGGRPFVHVPMNVTQTGPNWHPKCVAGRPSLLGRPPINLLDSLCGEEIYSDHPNLQEREP